MSSTPPVPVSDPAEQLARLRAEVNLAYDLESAVRLERDRLIDQCLRLKSEVRSLRDRVEPLERVVRLADDLVIALYGWQFDAGSHVGGMVRAIRSAIRDLPPAARRMGDGAGESKESDHVVY
jgi:hypothetical protein